MITPLGLKSSPIYKIFWMSMQSMWSHLPPTYCTWIFPAMRPIQFMWHVIMDLQVTIQQTCQCWLTSKNSHSSALCWHWMPSERLIESDGRLKGMVSKSQGNQGCWHALMMMIMICSEMWRNMTSHDFSQQTLTQH